MVTEWLFAYSDASDAYPCPRCSLDKRDADLVSQMSEAHSYPRRCDLNFCNYYSHQIELHSRHEVES